MRNYFSNRTQCVRIGKHYSDYASSSYGVPQGSILGPLLFIMFINDIVNLRIDCRMVAYADDIVLFNSAESWNRLETTITVDLQTLYSWTLHNRLSINFAKTKMQLFGSKRNLSYAKDVRMLVIDGNIVNRVPVFNYLGILLDEELTFEPAFNDAYAKVSYRLYTLSCIRRDISKSTAIAIVKSMVFPYFDYLIFLATAITDKLMTKCNRLMNRAIRSALAADRRTSVNTLYDVTKMMKLDIQCRYNILKVMHILVYSPLDFIDGDDRILTTPNVRTRTHAAPVMLQVFPNNSKYRSSLDYMGSLLWNSLLVSLRNIRDPRLFKSHLKRFVLEYN